ncbi:chromosome segregation ATPase [Granulicella aggregans]|uniref:Chromosome segregation ATPase n=1 Tax=Granulicella aggregans TaxID=474949 RepID=A0A7W8E7N3_9BACT|nr:hypothetical protein [Granulicella aggregans]MBB5061594.1 chromosome segregation ATPase [Granulicella aggregans]
MKFMRVLLVLGLFANSAPGQTSKPDTQTQLQILDELRAIHRDLRASTTLQLLLVELQVTQTTLDRAIQKRDTLKTQLTQVQVDKASAQAEVARFEGGMEKVENPEQQFIDRLVELKAVLGKVTAQEVATSEQLQDVEGRLRTAEAERENVQAQLSDLVKKLGAVN